MIQKLKTLILSMSTLFLFLTPIALTSSALAATNQSDINGGLNCGSNGNFTSGAATCSTTDATSSVNNLITTVINVISVIVGTVAVIMIIVGGLRYVTSGGNQESVGSAKNMIMYAIIGLVIVALAQIIVHFVLQKTVTSVGGS